MSTTDEKWMDLALEQATAALAAGEFPVGALIVGAGQAVASGRRQHSRGCAITKSQPPATDAHRLAPATAAEDQPAIPANELEHAEMVALRELLTRQPAIERAGLTIYTTLEPCLMCYAALLLNGVHRIVYAYEDTMGGGTKLPLDQLAPLYRELAARVTVIPHVRRARSLALFKEFFTEPANTYWQNSPLAEYTLSQKSDC
ncbi:MAG: nucleoside deaminase [Desulfurivibrio sp.]|nr:nucleoside deaminase [Desulfurivibrio sp.]